jgi:dienelactone hydrolase
MSRVLNAKDMPELQPIAEIREVAKDVAEHRFTATDTGAARAWQVGCRTALGDVLGFLDAPSVAPLPEVIEEVDRGDFVRRKIVIWTSAQSRMPVYLLVPKGASGPMPVALAYAGHGYGAKDIVGLWEDGEERFTPDGYHVDFAIELCRKGFLVAAPEIACFGERQNDYSYLNTKIGEPTPSTCHNVATYAFMLGKSAIGMRVRDSMRLIDWLATLPEADTSRIGAMGISGGGMLTFFHTAMDERVTACVVSGYFSSFASSILAMNHCSCNFVPNLLRIGEMEDIVGLIMPRPMLVEAGTRDSIFPIDAVRKSVSRTREICAILGGDPSVNVELDEFEGRHRISGRRAYDFLRERVG